MFEEINKQYPDYHFRYLQAEDYHHGVFETLGELTSAPKPTEQDFEAHLQRMKESSQKHVNIVGVDKKSGRVIAFGTVLICQGSFATTGKIENIVTSKAVRGKGLGRCVIEILKDEGWREGCDKISLFC